MILTQRALPTVLPCREVASRPTVLRWPDDHELARAAGSRSSPSLDRGGGRGGARRPRSARGLGDVVSPAGARSRRRPRVGFRTRGRKFPIVDDDDLLRYQGRWVALGRFEARMAPLLVERIGALVRRGSSSWPRGEGCPPARTRRTPPCTASARTPRRSAWTSSPFTGGAKCSRRSHRGRDCQKRNRCPFANAHVQRTVAQPSVPTVPFMSRTDRMTEGAA